MLKRLLQYMRSLLTGGINRLDNPEQLLDQAQTEMREYQARNRQRAVQAVTAKNNLQQLVNDMRKRIDALNAKAEAADTDGKTETAQKLRRERDACQKSLTAMEESLIQAEAMCEQVKVAIQYEEETIRRKTAEALALKAQWKNSQISRDMDEALREIGYMSRRDTNRTNDPFFRWLLASYIFIVLVLLLVLLIIWIGANAGLR